MTTRRESTERQVFKYSPDRRTALVLCGTGAHGAYHAGVLRALQEAGVKIDVMAGQGIGAASAALAAIDGAARLWEKDGFWRADTVRAFYRWRWALRVSGWLVLALAVGVVGLPALAAFRVPMSSFWIWLPSAVLAGIVIVLAAGVLRERRHFPQRRVYGRSWWRLFGAPIDGEPAKDAFAKTLWQLIRGASHVARPDRRAVGRRYAEVLADNLGQPGFRELMLVATDLDSHRDVVAGFLQEPHHAAFVASRPERERQSEAIDLAGAGRDHAFDMVAAALTPPAICDPELVTFGVDSYWQGETHRLCDRPGACARLLEELAGVGVSQVIVVSAVASSRTPHHLTASRLDPRHRLGEFLAAAEAAALRDALQMARLRFDSVYVIAPAHNPVGAFDLISAYDEASDRRQDLVELMGRAYEDAYHQFIEPVVGASGEHLVTAHST